VWGGEVLVCDETGYTRASHLARVPLPGGDRCAREGWRMAAAYGLAHPPAGVDPARYELVRRLVRSGLAPVTTSAGRLFDAVASLLGVCHVSTYEGEAAARLEAMADPSTPRPIHVDLERTDRLFAVLAARHRAGEPPELLSAVFHETLAAAIVRACVRVGLPRVALSGGCFQNRRLLESCMARLRAAGMEPFANERVPANDGGISLGQALVATCAR
jgi:hydrogenase maturation protein HypF